MADIERRPLGRTGLEVTTLGFGAMELRGPPTGPGKGATGGRRHPEPAACGRVDRLLRLLAQSDAVEELALSQSVDGGHGQADRVA